MPRLTRKPSAVHLLSLNAEQAQTEQQALHIEIGTLKKALECNHTAFAMLRDDVERFKGVVRAQDTALRGMREEVVGLRGEVRALAGLVRPGGGERVAGRGRTGESREKEWLGRR
ncbi:hypothetical protein OPT61_g1316 [Boeremia exigua]|uniref:Uncharacterized protein n=1 Tax=Boeremia exigua TaxID=749465 RepID=A0ACC2IQN9_9PLEO|nr:hypothetical protein OPT61_g1316 [Boeremia exigua]